MFLLGIVKADLHTKTLNSYEDLKDKYSLNLLNDEIKLIADETVYKVACQIFKEKDVKHHTYLAREKRSFRVLI